MKPVLERTACLAKRGASGCSTQRCSPPLQGRSIHTEANVQDLHPDQRCSPGSRVLSKLASHRCPVLSRLLLKVATTKRMRMQGRRSVCCSARGPSNVAPRHRSLSKRELLSGSREADGVTNAGSAAAKQRPSSALPSHPRLSHTRQTMPHLSAARPPRQSLPPEVGSLLG